MRRVAALLLAAAGAVAATAPATADVTLTDIQVAARALSFMESPPSGNVRVGIVYDPSETRTSRQARQLRAMLDGGLRVGNLELEPTMVSVDQAAEADVDVFFLTEHLGEAAGRVAEASNNRGIPCATTDIEQVRNGLCALGIRSAPKVEILVNRSAADKSGTTFATAFRLMINEL